MTASLTMMCSERWITLEASMTLCQNLTETSRYLTGCEVADLLRVKESTLAKWRVIGTGPKWVRLPNSRTIRYRSTDIDDWLRSCTYQSTREADDAERAREAMSG